MAKTTIMVTIQWGCVQFADTESIQLRECLPSHMAKGGRVSKVAKVKVVEATQCVGDFLQVW